MKKNNERAVIVEVSPRDGLTVINGGASTEDKIMYINGLAAAGVKKIECAAFSHPRLIPQNADAEKIMAGITKKPGVTYVGLVPNEIGCRRALMTQVDEILTLVAASDVFNRLNTGKTKKETLHKVLPAIFEVANKAGKQISIYIQTAFGCPYSGEVSPDEVLQLFLKLTYMGAKEVVLVDSTGMANPRQVSELIGQILGLNLAVNLGVHFHDTRGVAIANCIAAYDAGARNFYTSIGGLSGTPYGVGELAFGYWNVPTEDLVHLLKQMGIDTGIEIDRLLDCVKKAETLAGKTLPGHLLRARPASQLSKIPDLSKKSNHDTFQ